MSKTLPHFISEYDFVSTVEKSAYPDEEVVRVGKINTTHPYVHILSYDGGDFYLTNDEAMDLASALVRAVHG